ncbi:MAG TPA: ATP-dependent Clp protease ATP-binding subunit [Verrucomicrobiae bacterium]|nr:ATP-dependent Clp protease ATP-binding subunit [Verrucomicrobiae bacterium]
MNELIKNSGYLPAIRLEKIYPKKTASLGLLLSFALGSLLIILAGNLSFGSLVSIAKIFGAIGLIHIVYVLFLAHLQEDRKISDEMAKNILISGNYGQLLDFFSAYAIHEAVNGDRINAYKLLEHLSDQSRFKWILKRLNISSADFLERAKKNYSTQNELDLNAIILEAVLDLQKNGGNILGMAHWLPALYRKDKNFNKLMFDYDIKDTDLWQVGRWERRHWFRMRKAFKFWDTEKLVRVRGIGKDWSSGYTPNLDKVGTDLTNRALVVKPHYIYGHKKYIEMIEQYLVDGSHNVLLVGQPGVGRHTIIEHLAKAMNSGEVLRPLQYQHLVQIDTSAILSGRVGAQSALDKIHLLFSESLWAGNIILVINDIDALFDTKEEVGRINATEALLPFLKSRLKVIGLTTQNGYQSTISKNAELGRWFGKIEVVEPDFDETLKIVEDHAEQEEFYSGLFFTYQSLKEIVELATRLIQSLPNPEKSLEILEATTIALNTKGLGPVVIPEHIQKVISERTQVPVEKVKGKEKDLLLNLESALHQRIIGQDEAVKQIANALRRARSGIRSEKRPIGSFLFLGPTGVGKTETTKALAAVYFGGEHRIIRLDMSEFQEVHAVNRLIGDADKKEGGLLTEAVISHPFSIILLDEIEKAHPKILDLFLQVLDEGRLTDALGRVIDFTNCMIIATSNAGAEVIRQSIKDSKSNLSQEKVLDYIQKNHIFRPEFINRFDGTIIFKPLKQEELLKVAELLITDLNMRLKEKEISVKSTPDLLKYIVSNAYSPEYGARPLRRFISEHIENYIAQGLIKGSIRRGQVIEFSKEMINQV